MFENTSVHRLSWLPEPFRMSMPFLSARRGGRLHFEINLSRLPSAIRSAVKRRLERLKREARHALRSQNDALLKVNRELDSFVYSVSHNLRGPLASVMGLLNVACGIENVPPQLSALHGMMASDAWPSSIIRLKKFSTTHGMPETISMPKA